MTFSVESDIIYLEGDCAVEEAEHLLASLQRDTQLKVDVTKVGHLHTAIVQILFAMRPPIVGSFADSFQSRWLVPLLIHST